MNMNLTSSASPKTAAALDRSKRVNRSFDEEGYVIVRKAFPVNALSGLARALSLRLSENGGRSVDADIMAAEAQDHALVYKGAQSIGTSAFTYRLLGQKKFLNTLLAVTGLEEAQLHFMPLYLIIQLPGDQRFDYGWHQDRAYYTWCQKMITLWFPVNRKTTAATGTISVIPGSHRQQSRGSKIHFRHGFFRQIESEVESTEAVQEQVLELEAGDCCIMDGDLVHRSVSNMSDTPRVAAVLRIVSLPSEATYQRDRFFCLTKS
jgi:ectoine hydroxylase-related dioxygenase (phytanoyl-CoA dioxygenase family)